ncbi:DNA-processing protein DprA [Bacillus sp. FJAT-42315]|uniref:DNA-processing protein DprA n=1 Tax=Bacillus sp. FJAT-42315 TaxID=2014077 RepID=UPI000C23F295|nr:DNA-processing protein DprA [Bacillus sp. FJAT-42315]
MDLFTKKLIHLQHCPWIGWKSIYLLLKKDPNLDELYNYSSSYYSSLLNISSPQSSQIIKHLQQPIEPTLQVYESKKISFIPLYSEKYPKLLSYLPQPPWGLYALGDLSLLSFERKLAIVGARKADEYGLQSIQLLMPKLVEHQCVIVSGLAKGIDIFAHKEAMKLSGRTIAVIAGGFQHLYPAENVSFAREMAKTQLILSEYPPNTRPEKWQFPARNRIISGLSLGTLVIQAGKRSGSLITAYCALEQGRDVFCIPGKINDPLSEGTNDLINDGAKLVRTSEDILNELIKNG